MHPAPNLVEAPPKASSAEEGSRAGSVPQQQSPPPPSHESLPPQQQDPAQQHQEQHQQHDVIMSPPPPQPAQFDALNAPPIHSSPPPMRQETDASLSTQATMAAAASAVTNVSTEPPNSSSRRTGPLSQQQREKAALIRKLGACIDCRRRRVACHPSHHNMTWEDAVKKYHRSHSPSMQEIAPSLSGQRPLSPSQGLNNIKAMFSDPNEMDIDSPQPGQARLSETRLRTPLPSGPRLDKPNSLPGIESLKTDLQANVSRILSNPHRSRYASVQVLLLYWQDDTDPHVESSVTELAEVLDQFYRYTFHVETIPSTSEACKSPWRWLSRKITDFSEDRDQRDVLKIVYYNGYSYLDGNREMVLASSRDREKAETLRWSGIQQVLEEACSDTLILMDAAYYPSSKMVRQQGVLELVAAAVSEEHFNELERCTFTKVLTEQLRTRASQRFHNSFSAAELHSRLLSSYPSLIQDRNPEQETITSFPSPLHMQMAGDARLPSILLAPMNISPLRTSLPFGSEGQQLHLSIRLGDDPIDVDAWTEWMRNMPDGVKDVRVDGPYRPSR